MREVQKNGGLDTYKMTDGREIVLGCKIASGNQADIYKGYDLTEKKFVAVKHLHGRYCDEEMKPRYYQKCCLFSRMRSPHEDIVWIYAISGCDKRNDFLYVMPLLTGYDPISVMIKDVMYNETPQRFDLKTRLLACLKIADIISTLHSKMAVYGDISDSNICFKIESGVPDIKLIDSDNVMTNNMNTGLRGSGTYRAAEVIADGDIPTINSDRHSLGVVTFRILCGGHPLYSEQTSAKGFFTPESFKEQYGTAPVFRFAPGQLRKKPKKGVFVAQDYTKQRWSELDVKLRRFFSEMFSQECLHGAEERPSAESLKILISNVLKKMDQNGG